MLNLNKIDIDKIADDILYFIKGIEGLWYDYIKRIDPHEKKYIDILKKELKRHYQEVFDNIDKYPDNTDEWTFDRKYWEIHFAEIESKFITALIKQEGQRAFDYALNLARKDIEPSFDIYSPEVTNALIGQTSRFSTQLVNTSENEIRTAIAAGLEKGETYDDLALRVQKLLGADAIKGRAELIARTETVFASASGAELGYLQSGVVEGKEWMTAEDERTCEFCMEMNGRTAPLGESFDVNDINLNFDYSAGAMPHPPLHCKCRCVLLPIIKGI